MYGLLSLSRLSPPFSEERRESTKRKLGVSRATGGREEGDGGGYTSDGRSLLLCALPSSSSSLGRSARPRAREEQEGEQGPRRRRRGRQEEPQPEGEGGKREELGSQREKKKKKMSLGLVARREFSRPESEARLRFRVLVEGNRSRGASCGPGDARQERSPEDEPSEKSTFHLGWSM